MNFTNNLTSIIDPTHGLLTQFTKPDKAAGAASKAALKAAGVVPGLGMIAQTFSKPSPNTAGLKDEKKAHIQMAGGGYEGSVQASKQAQHSKGGFAQAVTRGFRPNTSDYGITRPNGCVVPRSAVRDMRKLVSPNALDESLARML